MLAFGPGVAVAGISSQQLGLHARGQAIQNSSMDGESSLRPYNYWQLMAAEGVRIPVFR